jgi:hypothetical protein
MDAIRDVSIDKKAIIFAIAGVVIGLVIGLIFAWLIAPVEWTDATPDLLREDLRVDYLRMAMDSYSVNLDSELAVQRYNSLGEFSEETLELVAADPGEVDPAALQKFQALVAVEFMEAPGEESPEEGVEEGPAPDEKAGDEAEATEVAGEGAAVLGTPEASVPEEGAATSGATASRYILPVCGATLLIGVLLGAALVLRRRIEERESEQYDYERAPDEHGFQDVGDLQEDYLEPAPVAHDQPLATFRTTYTIGDDLYDDSFSIESPASGDFLGECGVGIAEAIGIGDPKKVSAFEIWLFDKNDIQTVTKILMSKYTFNDGESKSRLSAKGDPVLAEGGEVVLLETASLYVEARVVDLTYGGGALPADSFFERMTIELKAMSKDTL